MIDKISLIFAPYNLLDNSHFFKVYLLKIGPIFVGSSLFYLNKNTSEFVFPPQITSQPILPYHTDYDSFAIYDFWLIPKKSILHSTKLTIYYFQYKQLHNLRSFDIWYLRKISVEILGVRLMKILLFCHHYVLVLTINKTMFARG